MMYFAQKRHTGHKLLSELQWRALVRLWQAGEEGIDFEEMVYGRSCFAWTPTLARLAHFVPQPLIEYFKPNSIPYSSALRITQAGYAFYKENWPAYRNLYPMVEAPEPNKDE